MATDKLVSSNELPGLRWMDNGQAALSGDLLALFRRLDLLFRNWAQELNASEYLFPTFIRASELNKLDYFRSFPHLVTMPVTLIPGEANLKEFTSDPITNEGVLNLRELSPVRDVLTPAACYHFYIGLSGQTLPQPAYLTTCATCFRQESHYLPLERQWSFSMREIVCLGTADEVKGFLQYFRDRLSEFFESIKLPISWETATDPFFNPAKNPKYLLQKLDPVKTEMVFDGRLAIGSVNFHRNYFGEAFQITRLGEEAYSGCVAFGMERWIYAFLHQYGLSSSKWPLLAGSQP